MTSIQQRLIEKLSTLTHTECRHVFEDLRLTKTEFVYLIAITASTQQAEEILASFADAVEIADSALGKVQIEKCEEVGRG